MNNQSNNNRPIFIVSSPRSGSTLLRLIIDAHSKISIPPPGFMFPFIYPFLFSYGDLNNELNLRELIEDVTQFHKLKGWPEKLTVNEIIAAVKENSFVGVYSAIHEIWAKKHGKVRWGEKTPRNIFFIGEILSCFPDAQFIHIIRDGRDVAVDWVDNLNWPKNIYSSAMEWREHILAIKPWRDKLSADQLIEIFYEDLVKDPFTVVQQVCNFVGEDVESNMLKYHSSEHTLQWARSEKCHQYVTNPVTQEYIGFYKNRLENRDIQMLSGILEKELRELGYEVEDETRKLTEEEQRIYHVNAKTDTVETMKWNIWHKERRDERRRKGMWSQDGKTRSFG
jgi:hypothetical protein